MTTTQVDRLGGVLSSVAIKAPCQCGTVAPITLSGLQVIDGYTTLAGDRVLVMNQADETTNGIYVAATTSWALDVDWNGNRDAVTGTLVRVNNGTANGGTSFVADSPDTPIVVGTSDVTFTPASPTGGDFAVVAAGGSSSISLSRRFGMQRTLLDFGADNTGLVDSTTQIRNALITMGMGGGGELIIPVGTFLSSAKQTINYSNITLRGTNEGASVLKFNVTNDDYLLLQGTAQIEYVTLKDFTIQGPLTTKTAGNAINAQVVAFLRVEHVTINNPYNGALFFQTNTVTCDHMNIAFPTGAQMCKWDAPTTMNSSALTLLECTWQGGYLGANGFVWDGWATSLRVRGGAILSVAVGVQINNTRQSATAFPAEAAIFDWEMDGMSVQSYQINAGINIHVDGSDISNTSGASMAQGSADLDTILILPDTGFSETHNIRFTDCNIGNTQRRAVNSSALNVSFEDCALHDVSKKGIHQYPAAELGVGGLGSSTADTTFVGCQMGVVFGDGLRTDWGLVIGANVQRTIIDDCSFEECIVGSVEDNSDLLSTVLNGGIDFDGTELPITLPRRTLDPASPFEGQFWINDTSHEIKAYLNGTVTLIAGFSTQTANTIFAGPGSGSAALPTFRSMVTADVANNIVTNAKLAQMAAGTIKANLTGSPANATDATASQIQTFLNLGSLGVIVSGVDFSSGNINTDIEIDLPIPNGAHRYLFNSIRISGASGSLTSCTIGVWTGPGATGTQLVTSGTAVTVSSASENAANNSQNLSLSITPATQSSNYTKLYARLQAGGTGPLTACLSVIYSPES